MKLHFLNGANLTSLIYDNWHPLEQAHEEASVMKHTYERHCK